MRSPFLYLGRFMQENANESTKKHDADVVISICNNFVNELPLWSNEFAEYEDGYNYLAGDHYKNNIKNWWVSQRRNTRAYNYIFSMINRLYGDFLQEEERMRVAMLPGGTQRIMEFFNDMIIHIDNQNEAKDKKGQWLLSGLIKRGYQYVRYSDELDISGSTVFSPINEFEVVFDSMASDYFLDTANYIYRSRWMEPREIIRLFTEKRNVLENLFRYRDQFVQAQSNSELSYYMDHIDFSDEKNGKYRVIEAHQFEYKDAKVAINTITGESNIYSLEGEKDYLFRKINPDYKIVDRPNQKVKTIKIVLPGFGLLLEEKDADLQDGKYDIIPFSAYNYNHLAINHFGIFRNAKEPQDGFNEFLNEEENAIKIVNDPGRTVKPDRILNWKQVEPFGRAPGVDYHVDQDADIDSVLKFNKRPDNPILNQEIAQKRIEYLRDITGISSNMEGTSETSNENASLFAQRVKQARISLETMYYNWTRSKRRLYDKVIAITQENYKSERQIMITVPDPNTGAINYKNYVINQRIGGQVINDISVGKYKIYTDDIDRNPSARAVRFRLKFELATWIVNTYGPAALDVEWLFGDAELGDISQVIERINQIMMANADESEKQTAFAQFNAVQDLAKKQIDLENSGEKERQSFYPGKNEKNKRIIGQPTRANV